MADDEQQYLDVLDFAMRMIDDAQLAVNSGLHRKERAAAVLLDLLTRLNMVTEYATNNIPDQWRVH